MDNETKLSSEKINSIMKEVSEGKADPEALMQQHLDEKSREKLKSILSDPQKMKSIMESPLARKFFAAFQSKKDGE